MPAAFYYKDTTKAFHLYTYKDEKVFSDLYIQSWRVPEYIPGSIGVDIVYEEDFTEANSGGYYQYRDNSLLRLLPIVWNVKKHRTHTRTIRYDAEGNGNRPFNSIYIPYDIYLAERTIPERLQVKIEWL